MLLQRFFSHFISSRNTVKNCKMDLRFVFIVFLLKWTHAQGESTKPTHTFYTCVCVCAGVCLGILFVQLLLLLLLKCSFSRICSSGDTARAANIP